MRPGPPGWGLGVGLATPPHKKLPVRKPEMWLRKEEEVHYGGERPHWATVPSAKEEEEEEEMNMYSGVSSYRRPWFDISNCLAMMFRFHGRLLHVTSSNSHLVASVALTSTQPIDSISTPLCHQLG